jgi:DNA mismatch endonuclease (patch repair protein)
MASIRGRDTGPELVLRRALWASGARGWRCHWRAGRGWIDIAFTRWRVAVFVDGSFWHGHPSKWQPGKWQGYWDEKIKRNIVRDRERVAELERAGWTVLRFWDFEIEGDPNKVAKIVVENLSTVRRADTGERS